jgi:2-oxoglutarate dehydrogenase E2 component (dihydrolipoamide succinyltransferase)
MAEIEFKRRGTPLWAVVVVLLVIAGILYALFGRGRPGTAVAPADTTAPAVAGDSASRAPATAAAAGPIADLSTWADSSKMPQAPADAAQYVAQGLRMIVPALKVRAPMAGVQHVMLGAMADTIAMPTTSAAKQTDAAQAAFFATAYAIRDHNAGADLQNAAASFQLKRTLTQQRSQVQSFFKAAARALADTTTPRKPQVPGAPGAPAGAPAAAPVPAAAPAPVPAKP